MRLIIILGIIFLISTSVSATQLPFGVEGIVKNFEEPIIANISIKNLNNSYEINGLSNIGQLGRYSASIKGNEGDLILVNAKFLNESLNETIILEGLHKIDFLFDIEEIQVTKKENPKIPSVRIVEVSTSGFNRASKIRTVTEKEESEWVSLSNYPKNTVGFVVYEDTELEIQKLDGSVISKKLNSEGEIITYEKINIYDKPFFAIISLLSLILIIVIILVVRYEVK